MSIVKAKLTVLFQEPFWVGIYEREEANHYEVARIVFGAEPKDYEVYDFMLRNWTLLRFSPTLETELATERKINPKRIQRIINRQMNTTFVGTKAQQALKMLQEQTKVERKSISREERLIEAKLRFNMKQDKKKQKHRGH